MRPLGRQAMVGAAEGASSTTSATWQSGRLLMCAAALARTLACGSGEAPPVDGVYVAPGGVFEVDVPQMRNPFVKTPSKIVERRLPDGGADVTMSVLDLGEAWRFGVRAGTASPADTSLADLCDAELGRWRREGPQARTRAPTDLAAAAPRLVLENAIAFAELTGLARVYHVDGAALIHRQEDGRPRAALIDVAVARTDAGSVLFAVGQFDMPMDQWDFFINDVELRPQRVLAMMASDDMKALRTRVASLRSGSGR